MLSIKNPSFGSVPRLAIPFIFCNDFVIKFDPWFCNKHTDVFCCKTLAYFVENEVARYFDFAFSQFMINLAFLNWG